MTNNPYQAPSSQIENIRPDFAGYDETKFYSANGRFNRSRYLVYSFLMIIPGIIIGIIAAFMMPGLIDSDPDAIAQLFSGGFLFLMVPLIIALAVLAIIFMIKRLHDINLSGWWSIAFLVLSAIPVIGMLAYLFLYLKPGDTETNRFGPPGPPNSTALQVGAWICGILWALVVLSNLIVMIPGLDL